jgi:hypothetical protein
MEILGSMSTAAANGNDSFRMDNVRDGMALEGIMLDCQMPVNVTTTLTPTAADLAALLKYFLAQFSIAYGPSQEFKACEGISGDEVRTIFRFLAFKEVTNNFVGTATGTGQKVLGAQLIYLFAPPYHEGRRKLPGSDVCKTIRLDVSEGNTFPTLSGGASVRGAGAFTMAIVPMYRKQKTGTLIHLPWYRRINQSRLDVETPEGLVIAAWDDNAAFASTAIGKYLVRAGDDEVDTNIPPSYVNAAFSALIDAGGSNPVDSETLLYFADPFEHIERWPHGRVYIKLVSQDVPTIKLRTIFYPEMTEDHRDAFGKHIAGKKGRPLLVTTPPPENVDAHPGAAAIGPHELVFADDNRFQTEPGVIATHDGKTHLSIPKHVSDAVHAVVGQSHPGSHEAVRSHAIHSLAKRVAGSVDTRGNRRGGVNASAGIHAHFESLGVANTASK